MPLFIAALWGALIPMLGTMVGRILVSLGVGYVSYSGLDLALTWARTEFLAGMSGAPLATVQMAGALKIGVCVSMLLSAVAARLVLAGVSAGVMKSVVIK